ncbi:hypothetical protein [Bradyrhizobium sp. RDM4]|uniref:hypothetical protein n=1 Tax=Bradyrhizobium sp. RDM4 TaxID=3378765 RepID=UPI0038FC31CE
MTTAEAMKHIHTITKDAHLLPDSQRLLVLDRIIQICLKASVTLAEDASLSSQRPPVRSLN